MVILVRKHRACPREAQRGTQLGVRLDVVDTRRAMHDCVNVQGTWAPSRHVLTRAVFLCQPTAAAPPLISLILAPRPRFCRVPPGMRSIYPSEWRWPSIARSVLASAAARPRPGALRSACDHMRRVKQAQCVVTVRSAVVALFDSARAAAGSRSVARRCEMEWGAAALAQFGM